MTKLILPGVIWSEREHDMRIGIGLHLFTCSVIATQCISGWLHRALEKSDR